MAFVITQTCCNDASCVPVCPVDCIRLTPEQREFGATEKLHIDPSTCVDCGACVEECPVGARYPDDELPVPFGRFRELNAAYISQNALRPVPLQPRRSRTTPAARLRVAIVGAGPARVCAAEELLSRVDSEVTLIDRLPTPFGLVRAGVAPDHGWASVSW